jgi:Restriction endonuclease S subunits
VKIEEVITYNKRPSRANMQPVENSVWLARMINSPKFLKANKDLIENKILSTGFLGIQTEAKETCDYLFYYIQTKEFQEYKDAYVTGAVQESLTNESAKDILVIIPPLSEQSRIATILSWFDDLIEVKKRQNEILEKTAMAIFKSWFIDFEPFMYGEFVYSEELGKEIPKGWEVKKIGEVAEIIMGQSPPSKFYNEDGIGIPFIQGKGQLGKYTPQTTIFCSCDGKLARVYDILLTVRAPVGELNLADKEYIIGRGIASIRSNYWPFLFLYFNFNRELLKSLEKGTTYDAIVKEDIENLLIVLPPSHILQSFHSLVEPLFQKIILNQKQIMTLRKIRDTLLPLLVFGKLRVEEV